MGEKVYGQERESKKKRHGKLIKCDCCKNKLDLDKEKELENVITEKGVTVLYCDCGNQIVIK